MQFFAGLLHLVKEFIATFQGVVDERDRFALAQGCEKSPPRFLVPQPLQGTVELEFRDAEADVARSNLLDRLGLIEDHKIVPKQNPPFDLLLGSAEQHEKQRVVEHEDVGGKN